MTKKKSVKGHSILRKIFIWIISSILIITALIFGIGAGVIYTYYKNMPDIGGLEKFRPGETSRIYASNGELIAELYDENRTWIPIKKIPRHLINAIVSIEDDKFYEHHGISVRGILRAVWSNIREKGVSQGGSTITQQLARNLFLSQEQSIRRKVTEILLSIQIERKFTKDEILEMYLNQIFLGSGAFGIEAASRTYFGKSVTEINLGEAALLAGLPQAPSLYSPFVDMKSAKARQTLVLKRMAELGKITSAQAEQYIKTPIKVVKQQEIGFKGFRFPYFSTYCLHELVKKYSSDIVYRGGIKVYSTLDISLQEYAKSSIKWGVDQGYNDYANFNQAALVSIENKTGFIRAMIGGYDYNQKNQFNRAWQSRRQPGSAFKIFVYTAALNNGITPDTVFKDEPVTFTSPDGSTYSPQNSDWKFYGPMTMSQALRQSRNVIAVKIMDQIGAETVIQHAKAMGINDELKPYLSLALGSADVSVLEMASAVSVLGNMGVRLDATTIKKIEDSEGRVVEDNSNRKGTQIVSPTIAYTITQMLEGVISGGTGYNAYIGRPAAGKTGTTSDFRDAWFVGYTPDYSTAVWVGNDDFSPMGHVYGGDYPALIWADFMRKAEENLPVSEFKLPEGEFTEVRICPDSGLLAGPNCPKSITKSYSKGFEPKGNCNLPHKPTPAGGDDTKAGGNEEKLRD